MSGRMHKQGGGVNATSKSTYLCLQCPNVTTGNERHRKEHGFGEYSCSAVKCRLG